MCCRARDQDKVEGKFVPYKERGCTDFIFLLAFIAGWAAIISMFGTAAHVGEPDRLVVSSCVVCVRVFDVM